MREATPGSIRAPEGLYEILDAGERGYAVAAANVNNRALKMLFKTCARQRADLKEELRSTMQTGGARGLSVVGAAAMIHRGCINIFAALTIGNEQREQVVVKEVLVGERAALRKYEAALKRPLPESTRRMVQKNTQRCNGWWTR